MFQLPQGQINAAYVADLGTNCLRMPRLTTWYGLQWLQCFHKALKILHFGDLNVA